MTKDGGNPTVIEKFYSRKNLNGSVSEYEMVIDLKARHIKVSRGLAGSCRTVENFTSPTADGLAETINGKHFRRIGHGYTLLWTKEEPRNEFSSDVDDMLAAEGLLSAKTFIDLLAQ
jgi:hypothetical protein